LLRPTYLPIHAGARSMLARHMSAMCRGHRALAHPHLGPPTPVPIYHALNAHSACYVANAHLAPNAPSTCRESNTCHMLNAHPTA
jgi:hypothetical protein